MFVLKYFKPYFLLFTCLISALGFANMANPIINGTVSGRPFVSKYVNVIHEELKIEIDSLFKTATFTITYSIASSKNGVKIPFLFYAYGYKENFEVSLNGQPVSIQETSTLNQSLNLKLNAFTHLYQNPSDSLDLEFLYRESEKISTHISLKDMLYFESDIPHGIHNIKITYKAEPWIRKVNWIDEYSFRYALSPARYWKSFGTLNFTLKAPKNYKNISVNLKGDSIPVQPEHTWSFDSIPVDILEIKYHPKVSKTAQFIMDLTPNTIMLLIGVLLACLHYFILRLYRKYISLKKNILFKSIINLFVPLLSLLSYYFSLGVLHQELGGYYSMYHAYMPIFVLFFYPIVTPLYWFIFKYIDKNLIAQFKNNQN